MNRSATNVRRWSRLTCCLLFVCLLWPSMMVSADEKGPLVDSVLNVTGSDIGTVWSTEKLFTVGLLSGSW